MLGFVALLQRDAFACVFPSYRCAKRISHSCRKSEDGSDDCLPCWCQVDRFSSRCGLSAYRFEKRLLNSFHIYGEASATIKNIEYLSYLSNI